MVRRRGVWLEGPTLFSRWLFAPAQRFERDSSPKDDESDAGRARENYDGREHGETLE